MAQDRKEPPPGVEVMADEDQKELDRLDKELNRAIIEKIMNDPDFGRKLIDSPQEALKEANLVPEMAEAEAHGASRRYSKWRYGCWNYTAFYDWGHWRGYYWA